MAAASPPLRMLRLVLPLVASVAGAALMPAPAGAAVTGPCLGGGGGPTCHFWKARVLDVNDGDTIYVDVAGDGRRRRDSVRFSSIQAMELDVYHAARRRGECHAVEATERLEQLIRRGGRRVRLAAREPSSRAGHRLRRHVAVRLGGRWVDLGTRLVREGHALWMSGSRETAWNARYRRAEQQAAGTGRGLWDPVHCGRGPQQDVPVRLWVNWDAPGDDARNANGEWIKVRNLSRHARLDLGGWWVRDAGLRRFTFPAGTALGPGQTATVHVGRGSASDRIFFWGLEGHIFENAYDAEEDRGGGAYLFDPRGDLRASMAYPCVVACSDPLQGAVAVRAEPRRDEHVVVRNLSARAVDLYGYAVAVPGSMLAFGERDVLAPGASLRMAVPDGPRLPDRGGAVRVTTFSNITLACDAWGSGGC